MKFKKAGNAETCGSCLQGIFITSYDKLVAMFGEPHCNGDEYKVRAYWGLVFEDGTIASVYDWKEYDTELGDVTHWHIGGHKPWAVNAVVELFNQDAYVGP
jgi:hypothetical protein